LERGKKGGVERKGADKEGLRYSRGEENAKPKASESRREREYTSTDSEKGEKRGSRIHLNRETIRAELQGTTSLSAGKKTRN